MQSLASSEAGHGERSFKAAYVLTINVVFGSGVLAMPHALQQAGFALGEAMLAAVSMLAWVTVMWTVEATSRLCFLNTLWDNNQVARNDGEAINADDDDSDEEAPMVGTGRKFPLSSVKTLMAVGNGNDSFGAINQANIEQVDRKWEVNQLCQAFLGRRWAMAYDACLTVYTWAVMWLYVTVWCQAFVTIVPLPNLTHFQECSTPFEGDCLTSYRYFVVAFTCCMAILCIREWKAFQKIQGSFTIFAYVCLVVMLTSIIVGLNKVGYVDQDGVPAGNHSSAPYWASGNKAADFSQFGALFGTCIFSQMAHQGTSQILSVMPDKSKAGLLFAFCFLTTSAFYTILAVAAALYFGDLTNSIVTLNWQTYSLNDDHSQTTFTKILFAAIVVFPVGTTSAAYMFFVDTIGKQLQHWVPRSIKEAHSKFVVNTTCRVIAFTPPIICGLLESNVKTIVSIAGLLGFFIMLFFPLLLQLYSIKAVERLHKSSATPFTGIHSTKPAVYAIGITGFAGLVLYIYNLASGN